MIRAASVHSPWAGVWGRLLADRRARFALMMLGVLGLIALLAPVVAPFDPSQQIDVTRADRLPPSLAHPFGTDQFSRDVLSRVLHGARTSLSIALLAVLLAATIGTMYGTIAGYAGGVLDAVMMRFLDGLLAIPRILLLVGVLAVRGNVDIGALILLLGVTGWFGVSRLVRAEVLSVRERDYIIAARALGARRRRIVASHVLPNVLAPVLVAASLGAGHVVVLEAGLSYLGVGVRPPDPSWGNMILDATGSGGVLWWIALFPGLAILCTVLAFTSLGDALRDALDPRARGEG
jgi:peptide/nickel transport system permease protein